LRRAREPRYQDSGIHEPDWQQHHPIDVKTYHQGANRDIEKEFLGTLNQGEYIDARNFRPTASEGDSGSADKLLGEEVFHPNEAPQCIVGNTNPLQGAYLCTGSVEINDHIVDKAHHKLILHALA